jgi:hypothetical protein
MKHRLLWSQGDVLQYDETARRHYADLSSQWLGRQSKRLGVSREALLAAIRLGHTPDQIQGFQNSRDLWKQPRA